MSLDTLASDHGRSGAPTIDRAVLGHWLNGDDAAIDALLGVFLDSICDDAMRMRDLLARDELKQFSLAAHRLRGAALSMGARALADFVGTLYSAAQTNDRDACVDGMPTLAAHVQLVVVEVPGYAPPGGI
ncbi:MAG TPA: Hpt domain-containing protein [Acetobacteraceae bacterium]|jgi:HPt (histidine-containing phosphotransfer) domain-containing protein|nr:Hpt domain-containing protein [Acetobacteraceae bacterium]